MNTKQFVFWAAATLLTIACIATAAPTTATAEPAVTSEGPLAEGAPQVTATDSTLILGQGADVAVGTFGYQTLALNTLEEIAAANETTFVSLGVDRDAEETYWINFTTPPPEKVLAGLRTQPFNTRVSWGYPLNDAAGDQVLHALASALDNHPSVTASSVEATPRENTQGLQVIYELAPSNTLSSDDIETVILQTANASLSSELRSHDKPIPVSFTGGKGIAYQTQVAVKGGHSVPLCTTGFTASNSGDLGVITAGHCSGFSTYDGASGVITSVPATRRPLWGSGRLDVQFGRTNSPHTTTKIFRSGGSSETTVTGVGTPREGMSICKYGLETGRDCGSTTPLYIVAEDVCRSASDGYTYCALSGTNRQVTADGDSGGPWFVDSGAYGITSGGIASTSYLTSIPAIEARLITIRQN